MGLLLYYNFLLFEDYFKIIVWAFLLSQALRGVKDRILQFLEYLRLDDRVARDGVLISATKSYLGSFLISSSGTSTSTNRHRRTFKFLLLDHGIFIFAIVGATSMILRVVSIQVYVGVILFTTVCFAAIVGFLDRRVFLYRVLISDEVLVTSLLMAGMFAIVSFVVVYLLTESVIEGARAATEFSEYVKERVIYDEGTRRVWTEQVSNGKMMIQTGLDELENRYNETMWWPPLKSIVLGYYYHEDNSFTGKSSVVGNFQRPDDVFHADSRMNQLNNMTFTDLIYFASRKVNLTTSQLSDWSSAGLGLSSRAVGSLAQVIVFVMSMILAFISLGMRAVFFVTSLFYLLCSRVDPLEKFILDLLPMDPRRRKFIYEALRRAIEGIFLLPVKISSLHAIVTIVAFSIMDADFIFFATLLYVAGLFYHDS